MKECVDESLIEATEKEELKICNYYIELSHSLLLEFEFFFLNPLNLYQ